MLSKAQIEAAAKAIALSNGWSEDDWENSDGPPHHLMIRHAKAALIAAEAVEKADDVGCCGGACGCKT